VSNFEVVLSWSLYHHVPVPSQQKCREQFSTRFSVKTARSERATRAPDYHFARLETC